MGTMTWRCETRKTAFRIESNCNCNCTSYVSDRADTDSVRVLVRPPSSVLYKFSRIYGRGEIKSRAPLQR